MINKNDLELLEIHQTIVVSFGGNEKAIFKVCDGSFYLSSSINGRYLSVHYTKDEINDLLKRFNNLSLQKKECPVEKFKDWYSKLELCTPFIIQNEIKWKYYFFKDEHSNMIDMDNGNIISLSQIKIEEGYSYYIYGEE